MMKKTSLGTGRKRQRPRDIEHYAEETSFVKYVPDQTTHQDGYRELVFPNTPQEQFLEREVQPGDTLQTLSLQFNCSVSELKRINNIIRENELFARRVVKIPLKSYSLLCEKLVAVHSSTGASQELFTANPTNTLGSVTDDVLPSKNTVDTVTLEFTNSTPGNKHDRTNDKVLELDNQLPEQEEGTIESPLLPAPTARTPTKTSPSLNCSGADWGLSWLQLLIGSLCLGFAAPVMYALYFAKAAERHKH